MDNGLFIKIVELVIAISEAIIIIVKIVMYIKK